MFVPCHPCPLKSEQQLIKSSLGGHGTQRSREAAVSCQSAWPWRGWCTMSGRPSQAADSRLSDRAVTGQVGAGGSSNGAFTGAELIPGLRGRDSLCWQTAKKQMLTTDSPHTSEVTGVKYELLWGLVEKGKCCQGWGGDRQDPGSGSLVWQLTTYTEVLRRATTCEHNVKRKGGCE